MNRICSCANPDCLKNGCILDRTNAPCFGFPTPVNPPVYTPIPLTEEQIRRIIREELDSINRKEK